MIKRCIPLLAVGVLLLSGCASQKLADQDSLTAQSSAKASEFGSDSERALEQAQAAYKQAVDEELAFYAPLHMKQLEAALKEAQQAELAGQAGNSVQASARVMTLLDNGLKNKTTALQLLAPVFTQKDVLDGIKAGNVLPKDYRDLIDDLSDLIALIEAGQSAKAMEKSAGLITDMKELELDTMLALHWQPAMDTLDKAEDEDADDTAAATFRKAEDKVDEAELFIRAHYSDRLQSETIGLDALRSAQHALFIGREAKRLQRLSAEQAEQAALKQEDLLHQIALTAGAGDMRHMAFKDQTLAIIQYIQEDQRARQTQQARTPVSAPAAAEAAVVENAVVENAVVENAVVETAEDEAAVVEAAEETAPETPAVETPAVETPAVETPAVETPAVETPAVETPAVETPAVETPAVETPAVETPAAEPAAATPVSEDSQPASAG
ncbi:hypothetical protein ACQUQU_14595 [Thalassolituus sp. LLYu03]|uniref:hypothetical protein n=1 Tax=Thalassolituus sp. LLYu03 TaxID=3421656 RepID=UPI003D2DFE69